MSIPTSPAQKPAPKTPHAFNRKILYWPFCSRCGLILLKNKATGAAASKLCPGTLD